MSKKKIIIYLILIFLVILAWGYFLLTNKKDDVVIETNRRSNLYNNDYCADSKWRGQFKSGCKPQDRVFAGTCQLGLIKILPFENIPLDELESVLSQYKLKLLKTTSGEPLSGGYGQYIVKVPECSELYWSTKLKKEKNGIIKGAWYYIQNYPFVDHN